MKPFSKTCYSENLVLDSFLPSLIKRGRQKIDWQWRESQRRKRDRVSRWIGLEVQVSRRPKEVVRESGMPMSGHGTHTA